MLHMAENRNTIFVCLFVCRLFVCSPSLEKLINKALFVSLHAIFFFFLFLGPNEKQEEDILHGHSLIRLFSLSGCRIKTFYKTIEFVVTFFVHHKKSDNEEKVF